jgi:protein involved in polysaccharide export with SLBB domain
MFKLSRAASLLVGVAGVAVTLAAVGGEQQTSQFYVTGYVRNAGAFPHRDNVTVKEAVTAAGRLGDPGTNVFRIVRVVGGKHSPFDAECETLILINDILIVEWSNERQRNTDGC